MQISPKQAILIGTSLGDNPVQLHFAALGGELAERGYSVSLLVHGVRREDQYVNPRIELLHWPSPRPTRLADALFFDRLVVRHRPGCLISNFGSSNIMMIVGTLRRVPIRVHWYHTLSSQIDLDTPHSQRLYLWLVRQRARLVYKCVTHSVANSAAARLDLGATFGVPEQKSIVFANSLRDPIANGAIVSESTTTSSSRFLCVGRFAWSKGQDVVVRAVAEVVRRDLDISVEFVGDGPTRESCQRLAGELGVQNHCLFSGKVPHTEVLEKMRQAWATLVPSRCEAFGLVNIESMAVGTPVVGSATGGIVEIVRDGVDGLLFKPEDSLALAGCLIKLAKNRGLRSQMSTCCRQRFIYKYEQGRTVTLQSEWLDKLIQGS